MKAQHWMTAALVLGATACQLRTQGFSSRGAQQPQSLGGRERGQSASSSGSQTSSSSSSSSAGSSSNDELANDEQVKSAIAAFEKALEGSKKKDMDALARADATKATSNCESDAGYIIAQSAYPKAKDYVVSTSEGKMSLGKLRDRCREIRSALDVREVPGCGIREVEIESLSLGGGQWSPAEFHPREPYFAAAPCKDMPKTPVASATMRGLMPKLASVCKGGKPVVEFWTDDWNHKTLPEGQILRTTGANCWISGTRSDWGKVIE